MRVLVKLVNGFHPLSLLVALAAIRAPELSSNESCWFFLLAWGIGTAHELGHVWGAHAVRVPVWRWRSIPGYGRTTTAKLAHDTRGLVVVLGGPVVGFMAAAAIGLAAGPVASSGVASGWLMLLAVAGMADNLLNLLPFWRLDGAFALRIVRSMRARRRLRRATYNVEPARVWRPSTMPRVMARPFGEPKVAPQPIWSPGPARVYRMRCPQRDPAARLRRFLRLTGRAPASKARIG